MKLKKNSFYNGKAIFVAVFFLISIFQFLVSPSFAETRIKTVEYNFGGYYSATDLNSNTQYNFPARTIKLPENGKTIRSAWLEYDGFTAAATNVNPLVIYFNQGTSATTAVFTSGQYTAQTGESIRLFARADVTSAIRAQVGNLASGVTFSAGVKITGPASNMHTAKLYVTYEYDDQSPTQVKTVRFPLYSDYANKIAAFTAQQAAGTRSMQYLADISENSGFKVQQQWFELKGFRQNAAGDGALYLNIGGGANEPSQNHDDGLGDSFYFRYLSSSAVVPGFSTGTVQTVNIVSAVEPINILSGEAVITYEFSPLSVLKTETVRYFLGQGTAGASAQVFSAPVYLREEGVTIKEIYARIAASYDSTTAGAVAVDASVGGQPVTQRSYTLQSLSAQISGYEFFHSLTEEIAGWTNGAAVGVTVGANASAGAAGVELIITYSYSNGAAHTASYDIYSGNSTSGVAKPYAYTSGVYWVEGGSSKTLAGAYVYANAISNATTQDFNTTVDFNGNSALASTHRTASEAAFVTRFYENKPQVQVGTTSFTANYTISSVYGAFGGQGRINYLYVPPPKNTVSLNQYVNGQVLTAGTWKNSSSVRFEGVVASSMNADSLALAVEVKPNASSFDNTGPSTGAFSSYSGVAFSTSVTVNGLVSGTLYKWRAAGVGDGNRGNWTDFAAPAFGVDLSSPPAPAMSAITPVQASSRNYNNAAFSFESVADIDGSGLKNYELWLATSADFTTLSFSSSPLGNTAFVSGLSEKPYYWKVRALDNAGNTGDWSAVRTFIVDLSSPTVNNQQSGDFTWRNANTGLYKVYFNDSGGAYLSKFQVKASSGPGQTGAIFNDWTDLVTGINSNSYSSDWALPSGVWTNLQSWTTNYISVRVYDNAGNSYALSDAFRVFKDTVAPVYTNGETGGDLVWRNTGRNYNLDFADSYSGLAGAAYAARTGPNYTGTLKIDTTTISGVGGAAYSSDWAVDFANLGGDSTNYISIEIYDIAGNTTTITDAFFVRKDTTAPTYTNGESGGDLVWRNTGRNYNFDFFDGGSGLSGAAYSARTGPNYMGAMKIGNTSIPGVTGSSSAGDWGVDFAALAGDATNYVSVEIYDIAGNTATATDAFFVKKDTTPPLITDNQSGDDSWRKIAGTVYNVDFGDSSSKLYSAEYTVRSGQGLGGSVIKDWTPIFQTPAGSENYLSDWEIDFTALISGVTGYVSVRASDTLNNLSQLNDAFYVLKDTVVPYIAISTPSAGYIYDADPGYVIDIDFFDDLSGLGNFEYKITTGPAYSGELVKDWTVIAAGGGAKAYSANWGVDFYSLPVGTWTYVSVRAYDAVGNLYEYPDAATYKRTASNNPSIFDNQAGDDVWRSSDAGIYNVDFESNSGFKISSFAVTAYSLPDQGGVQTAAYAKVADTDTVSYTADWSLPAGFWNLLASGTNYISVKVWDAGGYSSELKDAFYALKDTEAPSGSLSPPPYVNSFNFNVNYSASDQGYSAPSGVKLYYTYDAYAPYTWLQYGGTHTSSPISFSVTQYGRVGLRLIVYDNASNRDEDYDPPISSTAPEAYTLVDSTNPAAIDNQEGDYIWRTAGGAAYNVDFSADGGSPLSSAEYRVSTGTAGMGQVVKDWTYIAQDINSSNYTQDWQVDFDSLKSGVNYVSVRVTNAAGNSATVYDVFEVRKDTTAPVITDNQTGDYYWRNSNSGYYDLDFSDAEALLKQADVRITTGAGGTGALVSDWTPVLSNISSSSYSAPWPLTSGLWSLLPSGTSYVSVRVADNAGNYGYLQDAFFVLKDTEAPSVTDNQAGDDAWRGSNSAVYDIDFSDAGDSLLSQVEVKITSAAGGTGTLISDWTPVLTNINSSSYTDPWPLTSGLWSLLPSGTSYVSVRVADNAGSTTSLSDVFYVKKDAAGPLITDNQAGDDAWRSSNSGSYAVHFQDDYSGLHSFYALAASGAGQSGEILAGWTKVSDISGADYSSAWSLPDGGWASLKEGINYISVRSSDTAGNYSETADVFYVKKDTTAPSITDNQGDETAWHAANTGSYNVDFNDNSSGISKFQLKITTGPGGTGTPLADWTDNITLINLSTYQLDWQLAPAIWDLLSSGTSYVSIKVFDAAGLSAELQDAFKILKDTVPPAALTGLSVITGSAEGELAVSFNAPSDTGELDHYAVKYSLFEINDGNFDAASDFPSPPSPGPQGSPESFNITGLDANTPYYAAVKTVDKAGNVSAISNVVSAVSGADLTPPAAIADLGSSPGSYAGQIYLSWTATGDNVSVGTATAYQVRYRTDLAITNTTLWDGATPYIQSWSPKTSGEPESFSLSGLTAGTTYYFAVRALDEANNISSLSNSAYTWAQRPQGRSGIFVYQSGTNDTPYYKSWVPPNFSGAGTTPPTDALGTSNIRHVIVRASPIRREKIAGILSSDGVLQIQRYDGASGAGNWSNEWSTTTITSANSAYRGFDIAYEQNSGRAMVLYNGAAAGQLYYNIYDGSAWTGAQTLSTGTAYASLWVRLEARPNSDEIMAAFSKATSLELYATRWDGSSWTGGRQIRNAVGITTEQDWDLAWESQSGACLVSYNAGTAGRADAYRWNGSAWNQIAASYFSFVGANGTAQWIRLASDPNSNYIGATEVDSGSDWNASVWDGSSWGYQNGENTGVRNNANQSRSIDAAWDNSSRLVVVSGQGGNPGSSVIYSSWTLSGGWGGTLAAAQTFGTWSGAVYGVGMENDKDLNSILLWGYSSSSDLRTGVWNGTSFVFNPAGTHTTSLSQYNYMPVMLATDRHDIIPPSVVDNQSGDDLWRKSNDGTYNIDAADSGGSHLAAIQTRVYTAPGSGGTLIENWTSQVSTGTVDSYTRDWPLLAATWDKLAEGYNYISVRSLDKANNSSEISADAFYVKKDITAPSVPSLFAPADNSHTKFQVVYFDWSDASDAVSGLAGYEILASTDETFVSVNYSAQPSVSESASAALGTGKYYWKVRSLDNAGNYSNYTSTYAVIIDTVLPVVTDSQAGDDAWRTTAGTAYNVSFTDNMLIESVEYAAYTGPGQSGSPVIPWSLFTSTPINSGSYSTPWPVNFALLAQGTNYISVRTWDKAGSTATLADVFYVKKDTAAPGITDNQAGDDSWHNADPGAIYDVDFADYVSMLKDMEIKITTGPGGTGTLVSDWTPVLSNINSSSYSAPWPLTSGLWSLLPSGTSYVSVRVSDNAGNYGLLTDAFYVKKDTTEPSIPVLSSPADGSYEGENLVYFGWAVSTDAESGVNSYGLAVSSREDFSEIYSSGTFVSNSGSFELAQGTYYWKARALDRAGNYSQWSGTFSFIIDSAPPVITDNQAGDDAWRNSAGAVYNVDFSDNGLIESLEYAAYTGPDYGGVQAIPWTVITSTPLNLSSYTDDWQVNFALLAQGTNYISVRTWDNSGATTTLTDAFYIKKDTVLPVIADNQAGDDVWRAINGGTYDVDVFDGGSLLDDMEIKVTSGPGQTGTLISDWTPVLTGLNSGAYTSDWSLPFAVWELLPVGTSYVSLGATDNAGNEKQLTDVFYVKKDTNPVGITDNQAGDDAWRKANTAVYDVDANSPTSPVDKIQVRISTLPAYENLFLTDWTDAVTGINVNSYTANWALPESVFDAMLPESTNYVSVKVFNQAGAYNQAMDVFYVLKDTVAPYLTNNGVYDYTWRNSSGTAYNIDFADAGGSLLKQVDVKITTGSGQTGTMISDWSPVLTNINSSSYSDLWPLTSDLWSLLQEGTNYVSLRAYDIAGNITFSTDAFKIFKDTTLPDISDTQSGDNVWRNSNTGTYGVSFTDTGGSKISRFQVRASTNTGTVGPFSPDWTDNITAINASSYSADWSLTSDLWSLLQSGTNYISVRVYDNAGNYYAYPSQPFYVLKDTSAPVINNGQSGDYVWRNSSGTPYDMSFADGLSRISAIQVKITTGPGQTGTLVTDWAYLASGISSATYPSGWALPAGVWTLLESGTNYISVRAWDIAGSTASLTDAFRILKDTQAPSCSDGQTGEFFWRKANTGAYAVGCTDAGGSLISKIQLRSFTGPGGTGSQVFDWTDNQTAINASSINNWNLASGIWDQLLDSATNYVSVKVYDNAGSSYTLTDAFNILKDTTPVSVNDNQDGDDSWRASDPGAIYNVDFADYGSRISSAAYIVYDAPGKTGNPVIAQTAVFGPTTGYLTYTSDWGADFAALKQGYNYVSVRSWDLAGNATEYLDVFHIKKDTAGPSIMDLQDGDTTWYRVNPGAIFNVYFADAGIGISSITITASTGTNGTGFPLIIGDTVYLNVPIPAYNNNWGLNDAEWDLLKQGTNYISVTAYDGLNNSSGSVDVFYILKDTTTPSAISSLNAFTPQAAADEGKLSIVWTAPGDDGLLGSASYYMIRYSASLIDSGNFDSASVYISTLAPKVSGNSEGLTLTGLTAGIIYYAAIKSVDKAGNISAISNSPNNYAATDKTPPGAISDLSGQQGDFTGQIRLGWTARGEGTSGAEGTGTAYAYLVKYATFAITAGNFYASNVSTYNQTWTPLGYGQTEDRVMEGLTPGTSYSIAIKVLDEVSNQSAISNVIVGTATPAGAADGMMVYSETGQNNLQFRTWSPITWSAQSDSGVGAAATARWVQIKAVPVVADAKIAGVLYSDNSLKFFKYDGVAKTWSDITPSPAPSPGGSATRKFDIAVENNTGRVMAAYYNGTVGAVTYAIYSATSSAWVVNPTSLAMTALSGTVNWIRLKSMPGADRIAAAVLDSNSDISADIWTGTAWSANANLTTSASVNTKESFDIAWETLSGDLVVLWGTGTSTSYRKWYSTSTWAGTFTGPNPASAVQWIRLASDPLSNRIGASYLYGTTAWNAAIWRSAGTETWTASTADTTVSQVTTRIMDCAWQSKTSKFITVAVDEIGATDSRFKTAIWTGGAWTATPSAGAVNTYTTFAGSITWISLISDPNTDNITAYGIDALYDLRSTVWSGTAWADGASSANLLHENSLQDFYYESAAAAFDRHDNVPPTVVDNQSGDDVWRNSDYALYNAQATDTGGSHLSRIQTRIYSLAGGNGTLIQDWTDQVPGINQDSYSSPWPLSGGTFDLLPQGQSYVHVKAFDGVGNVSNILVDAFYVKKDTTAPGITGNLSAGSYNFWTSTGVGAVDVDFSDTGGSHISSITWSAWSGPDNTGSLYADGILIASGSVGNYYTADWDLDFLLLGHGTNYITVQVWDNALSSHTVKDAFKVLKDTQVPSDIANLASAPGPVRGSVQLTWTAPGDDGSWNDNTQGGYLVKYSSYAIFTEQLFNSATTYVQAWPPASAGSQESAVLYDLDPYTTYYFNVKTYDKAGNFSQISNSTGTLPQRSNVYINEIYPGGSAGNDWVELYNNTSQSFNMAGWKLVYKQGALDTLAAEVDIWTGGASDVVNSGALAVIPLSADVNSAQSYSLILKNSIGKTVDKAQWPSMTSSQSFSRIYDGSQLFEIDPTPTGGYSNSVSTQPLKLNEISYNGWQFAEIYNSGVSILALDNFTLRNSYGEKFRFNRKVYPKGYMVLDYSSISEDALPWTGAFGPSGLNPAGDYLVLEDSYGQTVDRVVWQSGAAYSLYNYKAQLVSAANFAPANSAASIIRAGGEGADSDNDASDFAVSALATPFTRNTGYGQQSSNNLIYPSTDSVLPSVFYIKAEFGTDYSAGGNDLLAFVRTGGAADARSPHIFRLADLGFDLSLFNVVQTSIQVKAGFKDIDGYGLSDGGIYKAVLTADSAVGSAPQIIISSVTADFSLHNVNIYDSSSRWLNEDTEDDVFKLEIKNNSSDYSLALASVTVTFLKNNGVNMSTAEAQNLFDAILVVKDSALGEIGSYESAVDQDVAGQLYSTSFNLDVSGSQLVPLNFSSDNSAVPPSGDSVYFVVLKSTRNASLNIPNDFMVKIDPSLVKVYDKLIYQTQQTIPSAQLQTSTITVIKPAGPPAGTNWPYTAGGLFAVQTMVEFYNNGLISNRIYLSGTDGIMRAVDYTGNEKWTLPTSPISPINTTPVIREEGASVYLYFANDNGDVYKVKDQDTTYSQQWKTNLGTKIQSNLIDNETNLYFGGGNGKLYCLNKTDGNTCPLWTYDAGFDSPISGTVSIDDKPDVNMGWIGLENGKVAAFRLSDGAIQNQFTSGGPIYTSPYVDSAYGYANNNLYIASTDKTIYSRTSSNLTTYPPYWHDYPALGAIKTSPWVTFDPEPNKYVFFGDESGRLYKISATSGTLADQGWIYNAGAPVRTSPIVYTNFAGTFVYFAAGEYLYSLDSDTRAMRLGYPVYTGGAVKGDLVIDPDADVLIFSSSDGRTYMIDIN